MQYKNFVGKKIGHNIKTLRLDIGGEYIYIFMCVCVCVSNQFNEFCEQ